MSLLVLAYPTISAADLRWIEGIRSRHDELYRDLVRAHFTLVFAVSSVDESLLIKHVQQTVADVPPISLVLRCALVVKDVLSEYTHVFLVPDEGFGDVARLHDRLYTGPLTPHLRLDIPYIPHIGVGNSLDPLGCKRLADELNGRDLAIEGRIATIDVVNYENGRVWTIAEVSLVR